VREGIVDMCMSVVASGVRIVVVVVVVEKSCEEGTVGHAARTCLSRRRAGCGWRAAGKQPDV
jgi:hypothetical protein